MKAQYNFFCITLFSLLLFQSCGLLEPKFANDRSVVSWVYAATDEYYSSVKIEEAKANPLFGGVAESMQSLANMLGGKYECRVPVEDRIRNTTMVDWLLNQDTQGDSFTGYLVTYRVSLKDVTLYVLVDLVEFDDSDRWEAEVVAVEGNLSSIRSYLE